MKKLVKIFRYTVLVLCLAYILHFFSVNKENLKIVFNLGIQPIILLCSLSAIYQIIHSYRFKIILDKCSGHNLPFNKWFKIFSQTRFLNLVIPQSGNIYRGFALKKNFNVSYTHYISAFSSFAWMDTCFNMTIASLVILISKTRLHIFSINAGLLLLLATGGLIIIPMISLTILKILQFQNNKIIWVRTKLQQALSISLTNLKDISYVLTIFSIGLVTLVRTILFYYILFRCFDIQPSIAILITFYALFKLSAFITITPGNLGIQELAFGFLSEQLGIGMAQGILICAVGRLIGTSVIISLGIMCGGLGVLKHRKEIENIPQNDTNGDDHTS